MTVFSGADRAERAERAARPDLSGLTNAELAEMCRERGIEPPKKARKADLVALLTE